MLCGSINNEWVSCLPFSCSIQSTFGMPCPLQTPLLDDRSICLYQQQPHESHAPPPQPPPPRSARKAQQATAKATCEVDNPRYSMTSPLLYDPTANSKMWYHTRPTRSSVRIPLLLGSSTVPLITACHRNCWTSEPKIIKNQAA